jgi:DNA-binding CsgD family transcriptional regulator
VRRVWRDIVLYGLGGGVLITLLKLTEYRFLVVEHSVEIYGGLVAALFSGLGIWLGLTLTRKKETPPAIGPNDAGLTPRETEILGLMAQGLSNREIAERLFVSQNTVKTHSARVYMKLGAKRRTQAVHIAKAAGLLP